MGSPYPLWMCDDDTCLCCGPSYIIGVEVGRWNLIMRWDS